MLGWIENHPGLASWVQAIGTIAAVGIAVWLPYRERRDVEKTAEVSARTPITVAMIALTQAWNFIKSESASFETRQHIVGKLELALQGLNNFALHTLSPKAAIAFQAMRDAFHMAAHGFSDPGMRSLGNLYLRCEFLEAVQKLVEHAPTLFDEHARAGLERALREVRADISVREARGDKPDDYQV